MPHAPINDYKRHAPNTIRYTSNWEGKDYDRYIPEHVKDAMEREFETYRSDFCVAINDLRKFE